MGAIEQDKRPLCDASELTNHDKEENARLVIRRSRDYTGHIPTQK